MSSPIEQAIRQICEEKGLAYESVVDAIQAALAAAYRKDFGDKNQNIDVEFNVETGGANVFDIKTVVEDVDPEELAKIEEERRIKTEAMALQFADGRKRRDDRRDEPVAFVLEDDDGPHFNPKTEIMISDARVLKFGSQVGDVLRTPLPEAGEFGRMAAMTAKQVITQKLREAEREVVFSEFKEHEGEMMQGTVQRREGRVVLVDLGRTTGIMRPEDQNPNERYNTGDRIKVYVRQVGLTTKGPEILLSRTADEMVKKLFEVEIPEIEEKTVEIKSIAREAGSRSKVAVGTEDNSIDPIGACIGQRGSRIQTIIAELGGEKVDIIEWNKNPMVFITNALSPAKIAHVDVNEEAKVASVSVATDQLSLAIGKGGQNVRLAAKLTGWKINIVEKDKDEVVESAEPVDEKGAETAEKAEGAEKNVENTEESKI